MHAQAGTIGYQAIVDEQVRQVQKQASRNRNFEVHEEPGDRRTVIYSGPPALLNVELPREELTQEYDATTNTVTIFSASPPAVESAWADVPQDKTLYAGQSTPSTAVSPVDLAEVIDHLRAASAWITELEGQVVRLIEAGDTLARNYRTVREYDPIPARWADTWDAVARTIAPAHKQTRPFAKASEVFGR